MSSQTATAARPAVVATEGKQHIVLDGSSCTSMTPNKLRKYLNALLECFEPGFFGTVEFSIHGGDIKHMTRNKKILFKDE